MVALQAGVSALAASPQMDVTDRAGNRTAALKLIATMPTIVAASTDCEGSRRNRT